MYNSDIQRWKHYRECDAQCFVCTVKLAVGVPGAINSIGEQSRACETKLCLFLYSCIVCVCVYLLNCT